MNSYIFLYSAAVVYMNHCLVSSNVSNSVSSLLGVCVPLVFLSVLSPESRCLHEQRDDSSWLRLHTVPLRCSAGDALFSHLPS